MNLTIVVTTIPERAQLLSRCLWHLEHQSVDGFEVVVAHGKRPKGDKVQRALSVVDTSHVMFVDDDDWVSTRLVESVLPHEEDFVGYDALQMVDGVYSQIIYQETASHICPIRTDLARQVEFGNHYLADIEWTKQVAELVGSTAYVGEVFYFYDKWNPTEAWTPGAGAWSPARSVGYWPVDKTRFRWI